VPEEISSQESETELTETINGILASVARHRWWVIFCILGTTLTAIGVALRLPNHYRSQATLLVVQPEISQRYVNSDGGATIADTATALTREVLSRPRLGAIIKEFGLYEKERNLQSPDELIERMRKDIEMEPLDLIPAKGEFSTFEIAFTGSSAHLAQEVTSRLASLFIEENFKEQGNRAVSTSTFLAEQLEAAKQKVDEQELRLRDFKLRNLGALPEQQGANVGSVAELRIQLQTVTAGLVRTQQQRELMESTMRGTLARLQSERATLMTRVTSRHPDVIKKDREIARVQYLIENVKKGNRGIETGQEITAADDAEAARFKRQVEDNLLETESLSNQEKRLNTEIATYQARLNLMPVREEELSAITRDYEACKQTYADLLKQQQQSQLTTKVEERQEGQHFRLLEPPALPLKPSSPSRLKISFGGIGVGAILGIVLTFLVESRNRAFHTEKALSRKFALPIILAVPLLLTLDEKRVASRMRKFEWVVGAAALLMVGAGELYIYVHG
jgi:polysaccharide biosynthesis transport protein